MSLVGAVSNATKRLLETVQRGLEDDNRRARQGKKSSRSDYEEEPSTWEDSEHVVSVSAMANVGTEEAWLDYLDILVVQYGKKILDDTTALLDIAFDAQGAPYFEGHLPVEDITTELEICEPPLLAEGTQRGNMFDIPLFSTPTGGEISISDCTIQRTGLLMNCGRAVELSLCLSGEDKRTLKMCSDKPIVRHLPSDEVPEQWYSAEACKEYLYYCTSVIVDTVLADDRLAVEGTTPRRVDKKYEWWKRTRQSACALIDLAMENEARRNEITTILDRHDGMHFRVPLDVALECQALVARKRRRIKMQNLVLRVKTFDKLPFEGEYFKMLAVVRLGYSLHGSNEAPSVQILSPIGGSVV